MKKIKGFLLAAVLIVFSYNLLIASAALTCSDPFIYSNPEQTILPTSSQNYVAAASIPKFPTNTKALTVVALFTYDGPNKGAAYPKSIFSLTVNSKGADLTMMELVLRSERTFEYKFNGNFYSDQSYGSPIFIEGNMIEVKIAMDLVNNQADMATTYFGDVNYDAPLPLNVDFTNIDWIFDQNTKFWFGGGPSATSSQRSQISAPMLKVWNGYLPLVKVGAIPYPGEMLLGHVPVLKAHYKLQDLESYGLKDESTTGTAYLGQSTINKHDSTNAPTWVANSPFLNFATTNDYLTIPSFTIGSPYAWVRGSLTISFWLQPTSPTTKDYIFRYLNETSLDRFAIKLTTSFALEICASDFCRTTPTVQGLSSTSWTQITVSWALVPDGELGVNTNFYYSVYSNGQLVQAARGNPDWHLPGNVAKTLSTDVVRFGGFVGKLGAIKIHSPGSLLVNLGTWCDSTTCAADLGVTNPPTCLRPASCHSSCSQCIDSTELGCLTCASQKYFDNGKCVSCPIGEYLEGSSCKTCGNDLRLYNTQCVAACPANTFPSVKKTCRDCDSTCDLCSSGLYNMNSSCFTSCPSPFTTIQVGTRLYCEPKCDYDQYNYWGKACDSKCIPPLVKKVVNNAKVCSFPCGKETDLLYWNGTCSSSSNCDPLYSKTVIDDRNFCILTCPSDKPFSYYNDTCQKTCVAPLENVLGSLCGFPCQSGEFLYWDNSCQKACPFPYKQQITPDSKKFCLSPCPQDKYLDTDGVCKSLDLPSATSASVIIGGQPVELKFIDKIVDADFATFKIFSYDYTIGKTWSFFGLNSMGEYTVDNWETTSHCGCFEQVCGKNCEHGISCSNNAADVPDTPWICHPWAKKKNYCWSVKSASQKMFTSYNLTLISTIALTSYGGPDNSPVSPGFTVTSSLKNQNYALGLLITDITPRRKVDLASSYRYIESEGMVITTKEFDLINIQPTLKADLKNAYCNSNNMSLPLKVISRAFTSKNKTSAFHAYSLLRRAQVESLTSLWDLEILTPHGVQEWSGLQQTTFDILDPCNQQFLTLRKDTQGNFYVKFPATQRFATHDSTICIAVNDVSGTQYDLVLYELKNGTSVWSASERFVGVLSNDFVQEMALKINTKANSTIAVSDTLSLKIDFVTDIDIPYMRVTTSMPTTCQLYLSPTCNFNILTTSTYFYAKESLAICGKYLYEKAGYNCEGISGYFYPPSRLVQTKINYYTENTTHFQEITQEFSSIKASKDIDDLFGPFLEMFTPWTWKNVWTQILRWIILVAVIVCCIVPFKIYQKLKASKVSKSIERNEKTNKRKPKYPYSQI